ncbi:MAG: HAD-IA family hydrolase [Paracoccaceae bacterium]
MIPKAVIFDCDGVLVDSEPALFALLVTDLHQHGLDMTSHQIEATFIGGTIKGIFDTARRMGATLPDTWVDDFYTRLYARLATDTPLIPGILTVLDALDRAHIPYAVGSNGTMHKMQVTLSQHPGVLKRLQGRLFSGQDLNMLKPAPDLYLHAARALRTAPEACVVIEDSATGAAAARAANIRCFGYAPHGNDALKAQGATPFHDMEILPSLLGL